MKNPTRRNFMQWASAGVAAAALPLESSPANAATASADAHQAAARPADSPLEMVNVLQGTNSTFAFSRGNTLPIVALPFGMAHWTLQTTAEAGAWFFVPGDQRTEGIRCTHQLSPWLKDYGYATFLPFTGEAIPEPGASASSYRPADLKIHPHFLSMDLIRYRTRVEVTPTERCMAMRITFGEREPGLYVDLPGDDATAILKDGRLLVTVHVAGNVAPGFANYYYIEGDVPFASAEMQEFAGRRVATVRFAAMNAKRVATLRVATSFISFEQAALNLKSEIGGKSFDEVRHRAETVWNEHLSRAVVEGGTEEQRRIFYSAMYRTLLFPHVWHEYDASGKPFHWSPYNSTVTAGVLYADHGYWDVYRAWYPWMSILFPERLAEILQSWVHAAQEGGWMPQFPCPGYRACMTGSLIDAVFGDAAAKGIKGFDLDAAYGFLKKHATQPGNPSKGYGRRGIEDYLKLGYVAVGVNQPVAETVDAAYGDFCIAQVAHALGHADDAAFFLKRSENWRNIYDPETKFLRGKHADGSWLEPFDPVQWGDPYVEGSAWQHRWDVPHQPEELMKAMGGPKEFAEQLELMLTRPADFNVGAYGREIHEMSEMAAVPFGQYAHSNQPVHHVLYLFAVAGRPDRLQYWVRRVLTELYTIDNFAGDEDTGSMSAWFLLSAMGFYPLCPGKAEYVIGAPLFDRITLKVAGGESIIEAVHNNAANLHVRTCTLNGVPMGAARLKHQDVVRGMRLAFTMSASPVS